MAKTIQLKKLDLVQFNCADYLSAERIILENLKASLETIKNNLPPAKKREYEILDRSIENLKKALKNETLNPALPKNSFYKNTRLWQNTSRFSPKITVEGNEEPSAFDLMDSTLAQLPLSRFSLKPSLRAAYAELKAAKSQREQIRKQAKRQFLYEAKNKTGEALLEILSPLESEGASLRARIEEIINLKSWDETHEAPKNEDPQSLIETRNDCLQAHLKMHNLALDLKKLSLEDEDKKNKLHELGIQLDEITKRWIDPHFKNPKKLSSSDKIRFIIKIASGVFCAVLAISAFVMLFTPLAPLAPLLGLIAMLGMAPIIESIASTIYNKVRYKRNPQKAVLYELLVTSVCIAFGVIMAQLAHLYHIVKVICDGFNQYGSQGLGVILNPLYTLAMAIGLKKGLAPRILHTADLEKHEAVSSEVACDILRKNPSAQKRPLTRAAHHLSSQNLGKNPPNQFRFFFISKEDQIQHCQSHHHDLSSWLSREKKRASEKLSEIRRQVEEYLNLTSASRLELRKEKIESLITETTAFSSDSEDEQKSIQNLIAYLKKEKNQLQGIEKEGEHLILCH